MTSDGRVAAATALAATLLVLVGACSSASGASSPAPASEVAVTEAKQVRGSDACALVDDGHLAAAGLVGPGVASDVPEGPRCSWRGGDGRVLDVTLFVEGGGIDTLAANSEPTTTRVRLEGYPALETFTGGGRFCQYDVAVADGQVVMAALENGRPDSCSALQNLLLGVLAELPRSAPRPG